MERIHKMPFILGCLAAMATGIASYATGAESRTIYLRMAVMMLVFFIIGLYARNTVLSIEKEVQEKKLEQEKELHQLIEEQKASASASTQHPLQQGQAPVHPGQPQGQQIHKLDLVAEGTVEDFEPLAISKAVSSKVKV